MWSIYKFTVETKVIWNRITNIPNCNWVPRFRTISQVESDVCINYRASCTRAVTIWVTIKAPEIVLPITGLLRIATILKVSAHLSTGFAVQVAVSSRLVMPSWSLYYNEHCIVQFRVCTHVKVHKRWNEDTSIECLGSIQIRRLVKNESLPPLTNQYSWPRFGHFQCQLAQHTHAFSRYVCSQALFWYKAILCIKQSL